MKVVVRKLYKDGYVDVRDYLVETCIADGEDLEIHHNGKVMTIPNAEIRSRIAYTTRVWQSRYGRPYRLCGFIWQPD